MSSNDVAKSNQAVVGRALGWGTAAAVGACAACCALPLLVAGGVGGGLATTLAGLIRPGMDLVAGGVVGLGVAAAVVVRRGARSGAESAVDGSCGCATSKPATLLVTPKPSPDEPVMCTADLRDRPSIKVQLDGYHDAFRNWIRTDRFAGGFRWVFRTKPGLAAQLRRLMQNESECCRFFEFELQSNGDELSWSTRAGSASQSVVDEFATLPTRLREHGTDEPGIRAIKGHAQAAGFVFSADGVNRH